MAKPRKEVLDAGIRHGGVLVKPLSALVKYDENALSALRAARGAGRELGGVEVVVEIEMQVKLAHPFAVVLANSVEVQQDIRADEKALIHGSDGKINGSKGLATAEIAGNAPDLRHGVETNSHGLTGFHVDDGEPPSEEGGNEAAGEADNAAGVGDKAENLLIGHNGVFLSLNV